MTALDALFMQPPQGVARRLQKIMADRHAAVVVSRPAPPPSPLVVTSPVVVIAAASAAAAVPDGSACVWGGSGGVQWRR